MIRQIDACGLIDPQRPDLTSTPPKNQPATQYHGARRGGDQEGALPAGASDGQADAQPAQGPSVDTPFSPIHPSIYPSIDQLTHQCDPLLQVPPCQRELTALLNAMDRKERGEEVSIRILQTALEHCLQQAVGPRGMCVCVCVCVCFWVATMWTVYGASQLGKPNLPSVDRSCVPLCDVPPSQ